MTLDSLAAACRALNLDPDAHGLQIIAAPHLARLHFPPLDPDLPALVSGCQSRDIAAQCQRALLLLYPRDHAIVRIAEGRKETKRLVDCARGDEFGHETFLYIPPLAHPASFNALANITAHLRAPEGCLWDREQTHASLRQYLLEECYEVLETIDHGDVAHLREELGDLMSLILLQIQIAYEANEFSLSDVLAEISAKLVRRHPHVFGNTQVNGMDELLANWERIKESEKLNAAPALPLRYTSGTSVAGGARERVNPEIPLELPALMRAQRVSKGKKRLRDGAVQVRVERLARARDKEKALGEALFALAAYAEANGLDAESALRAVARKQEAKSKREAQNRRRKSHMPSVRHRLRASVRAARMKRKRQR